MPSPIPSARRTASALAPAALGLALALPLAPAGALERGPLLGAEEFDAYVTGRTLTYSEDGTTFGTEEYLPDRRVRWRFEGEACQFGIWYPKGEEICFRYEYNDAEHCWIFWHGATGLMAQSTREGESPPPAEVRQSERGLDCPGPEVGV